MLARTAPPLIEVEIAAGAETDPSRLLSGLSEFADRDTTFHFSLKASALTLGGSTEEQLETIIKTLQQLCQSKFEVGWPQVAYREKLLKAVEIDEIHEKHTGGSGQFARVKIQFEPIEPGCSNSFESKIVEGDIPSEFVAAVENGFNSVLGVGSLAGLPVIEVKATLLDGAHHETDSSALAFEICSHAAFRRALREAGAVFEPIMKVTVTVPEEYTGAVSGDLISRRAQLRDQSSQHTVTAINAMVPLANMFGYANQLRSFSQGRGSYSMQFSHYAPVPPLHDGPFSPAIGMRA